MLPPDGGGRGRRRGRRVLPASLRQSGQGGATGRLRDWPSSDFNSDLGITTNEGESFGLSVLIRDDERVFRSYFTSSRDVEALGSVWTFLDLTPLGRQDDVPYRRHDEYEKAR